MVQGFDRVTILTPKQRYFSCSCSCSSVTFFTPPITRERLDKNVCVCVRVCVCVCWPKMAKIGPFFLPGSHCLSARRKRSRGQKGLQLEVGARRAPILLLDNKNIFEKGDYITCCSTWWLLSSLWESKAGFLLNLQSTLDCQSHWLVNMFQLGKKMYVMWRG